MNVTIDFNKTNGKIKPMHAVNNGPMGNRSIKGNNTYECFEEAGIPYARNHDASFFETYGGEYTVDVHRIFRNFDADPTDPANYDFECTDKCVADTFSVGTEVYYRLGSRIEHGKKVGTFPPKDFHKWAVICEHIIRHYNEGWANGFNYGIKYWEIWNEPDCGDADGTNPCWQGTEEEFFEFFYIAAKYLKEKFPRYKIGGPAFCYISPNDKKKQEYLHRFFKGMVENKVPLDFLSFHRYTHEPYLFRTHIAVAVEFCKEYGYTDTELHLNEWSYIRGWHGEEWSYSIKARKALKGASFVSGVMAVCQDSAVDMLMFYEAAPSIWNGMFHTDYKTPLKGYYPFKMFNELYKMGNFVRPEYEESPIYCTAAIGDEGAGIMLTNYSDDDNAEAQTVTLKLVGVAGKTAEIYTLDNERDCELTSTVTLSDELTLELPLFTTAYVKISANA